MSARDLVWLATLAALVHAASWIGAGPTDDDFILYRYAANALEGQGLVFQPGERVEGFTTPLWTGVCALAIGLGIDPARASQVLGILAAGLAVWAVGRWWRERLPQARWPLPALLLAALPAFAWHAVAGLGTSTLAAALAVAALLHERALRASRAPLGAAIALAIACLLRQESAVFALPFAFSELRRRRFATAALPLLALAGWTLFRLGYYGRWLPITYELKKLPPLVDLDYGLRYLLRSTLETGVLAALCLAPLAWRAGGAAERASARVFVPGLLLHALYVVWVGGDYLPFARFFVPALPLLAGYACLGAWRLSERAPAARPSWALVALLLFQWTWSERSQRMGEHAFFEQRWALLGRELARRLPPDAAVALSPIGAFGWHSRLPVIDVLGLTHEAALDEPPDLSITMKGHHRYDGEWVLDQRPAAVILGNGVLQPGGGLVVNPWERTIWSDPRLTRDYALVELPVADSYPLVLHLRADLPLPADARVLRR